MLKRLKREGTAEIEAKPFNARLHAVVGRLFAIGRRRDCTSRLNSYDDLLGYRGLPDTELHFLPYG